MKIHSVLFYIALILFAGGFTSCQEDLENYDAKIYNSSDIVSRFFIEEETDMESRFVQASIAKQLDVDVTFSFAADASLVNEYNAIYSDNATMLPSDCFEIPEPVAKVSAGKVISNEVEVVFKNLKTLDKTRTYVLPVTIQKSSIDVLASKRTTYFVLKEASLINFSANLKENNIRVNFHDATPLKNLTALTAEALVKIDAFADGRGSNISTVMGVENHFLIRFGDTAPNNQLQIATKNEKLTSSDWVCKTGKWTHIAVTYNQSTKTVQVYIDGKKRTEQVFSSFSGPVDWGKYFEEESGDETRSFWIGYSYESSRYLDGDICECRVWNKVLTEEEINSENHFYKVNPTSDGLVAYWKFNEGKGTVIKDYSSYGNDGEASNGLVWNAIELPIKK